MDFKLLADLLYKELYKLHKTDIDWRDKTVAIKQILDNVIADLTKRENIHFTTFFARIAFLAHKFKLSKALQWRLHQLRKDCQQLYTFRIEASEKLFFSKLKTACYTIASLTKVPVYSNLNELLPSDQNDQTQYQEVKITQRTATLRFFVLEIDEEQSVLSGQSPDYPSETLRIKYNETGTNALYNKSVKRLIQDFDKTATVNLLQVSWGENGLLYPKQIVLEPDFLLDVTAVADCFQAEGDYPYLYLIKRFMPFEPSKHLMLGNIANFFLDELINNPDADFKETFAQSFALNPLNFALFDNATMREIMSSSRGHFNNLKRTIKQTFEERGILPEQCLLEPTFYSERYGIQGRLDIWHLDETQTSATIIELKSGKLFRPNRYQINENHYCQTILYDMLTRSVFERLHQGNKQLRQFGYVLYSGLDQNQLKPAPTTAAKQDEILLVRNELIGIEQQLCQLDKKLDTTTFIEQIGPSTYPGLGGFTKRDLEHFQTTLQRCSPLERSYFLNFVSFIAREQQLAKTGCSDNHRRNGFAQLWLSDHADKDEAFALLSQLKLVGLNETGNSQQILLERTEKTNRLANFRQGDIIVLYPLTTDEDTALNHQIFKGSIASIDSKQVLVKLNAKQSSTQVFDKNKSWCIEPDMLDSSFKNQYQALFGFLNQAPRKRALLLSTDAPTKTEVAPLEFVNKNLGEEQKRILRKAISTEDYFLLVGPPGTGKTKFMLAEMVRHLLDNTEENIMLLAYTNRAVDEICDAIDSFGRDKYLRMSSRSSTDERFHDRLFSVYTEDFKRRDELKEAIDDHRIFVATVASLASKSALFHLKKFDTVIIDEASQILEPLLVNILPKFKRFVLVGDHKQLPAVVIQDKDSSAVEDPKLLEIGLSNRRNSLFERLFRRAIDNDWYWAHDMLSHQGRMHADISAFPSKYFYEEKLQLLPEALNLPWQREPLDLKIPIEASPLEQLLSARRVCYFNTATDLNSNSKTNKNEAHKVAELVQAFERIYKASGKAFKPEMVGIITPFRAQIGQIRDSLHSLDKGYENCTIDTVERYQGGAREIIIISLCLNARHQLESIVSLSDDEQVDRKLNVALTRAQRHLVLVGNEKLMRIDERYNKLIDWMQGSTVMI